MDNIPGKGNDYNQNQNENVVPEKRQSPKRQRRQGSTENKQAQQLNEAPSREDWEGGASRPEQESKQRVPQPGEGRARANRTKRNPEQFPKAGGMSEAAEDETRFEEGNRYGQDEQAA
jgi:hypothetical protein